MTTTTALKLHIRDPASKRLTPVKVMIPVSNRLSRSQSKELSNDQKTGTRHQGTPALIRMPRQAATMAAPNRHFKVRTLDKPGHRAGFLLCEGGRVNGRGFKVDANFVRA